MIRKKRTVISMAAAGILAGGLVAQITTDLGQWRLPGRDLSNSRSQPGEKKISSRNAANLIPFWSFTTGGDVSATPTVAGNAAYFPDWSGNLFSVHADTGQLNWKRQVSSYNGRAGSISRVSPTVYQNLLIIGDNQATAVMHDGAHVMAIDRNSGNLLWITQVDDHPAAIITGSPVWYGTTVYVGISSDEEALATNDAYPCCTFRGSMVALDINTGAIRWKTYTIPDNAGAVGGFSGNAIWSPVAIDPGRGVLYTATGNNYTVPAAVAACGESCIPPEDHFDSALALDLTTGAIRWSHRLQGPDAWTVACNTGGTNCPSPAGPDYDFGDGPNLLGNLVGFGQKSGIYWALNPVNGNIIWATVVGPGGTLGGIEWGTATDGSRIYAAISNSTHATYTLANTNTTTNGGSWAALDPSTGKILWQTADPLGAIDPGAISVANGVAYAGSFSGHMYGLDAITGRIIFDFNSGGSVIDGPSVVGGMVYWGSGYGHISPGIPNNRVYAFSVP